MSAENKSTKFMHHARTPRAAAIAGILFGILFSYCIVLVQLAVPANPGDLKDWTDADGGLYRWPWS